MGLARFGAATLLGLSVLFAGLPSICGSVPHLESIRLPPGFSIDLYADDVPGARSLTLGERGTVFVGTRGEGRVYALVDRDGDGKADRVYVVAEGLDSPNGVAFRAGALYVAEISRILRFDGIESRLADPGRPVVVTDRFPHDAHHGWKFIAFGPDGLLYVPVGAPCNVCEVHDPYGTIQRMRPDGTGMETFARGIRNTVGFAWAPDTGDLWFTDNGRDWLGDDLPPDELNHAPVKGLNFGFPYVYGNGVPDPKFGTRRPAAVRFVPPVQELGPHVAALGMRFYTGTMFPERFRKQVFIAEHGSWNRSTPIGYRVTVVTLADGRSTGYEVFASGWLAPGGAWGRPVDVLVMPDGALLVSDDRAGAVYRIRYEGKGAEPRSR